MSPRPSNPSSGADLELGHLAETLVADWLVAQGNTLLHRRWRCRWGELDLVAIAPTPPDAPTPMVLFVEVKARRRHNWDHTGLLAITPQKQARLWQTAELFLAEHADWATLPCRFDVALVEGQPAPIRRQPVSPAANPAIQLGQPVALGGYLLTLRDYIAGAF